MTNRAPLLSSATPFNRIVDLTRNPVTMDTCVLHTTLFLGVSIELPLAVRGRCGH